DALSVGADLPSDLSHEAIGDMARRALDAYRHVPDGGEFDIAGVGVFTVTHTESGHLVVEQDAGLTFDITETENGGHVVAEQHTPLAVGYDAEGSLVMHDVSLHDLPEEMAGLQATFHHNTGEFALYDQLDSGLLDRFESAHADPGLVDSVREAG